MTMLQTLAFANPQSEGVTGLRVFFVVTRSSIVATAVSGLPAATSVSVRVGDNGMDVEWTPGLVPGSEVLISLEVKGEPLVVSRILWFQGEDLLAEDRSRRDGPPAAAADTSTDPDTYARAKFQERCAAVDRHTSSLVRKYGRFFCELDVNTNLKLMDPKDPAMKVRIAIVRAAETEVLFRILDRRGHAPDRACGAPVELPCIPFVREISDILLTIYRRHLGTNGVLDANQVWTAFEMFANGELRVDGASTEVWNGEPDGAMAFGFAEFAFGAIDEGIDADEWCLILPSHVAMQHIYFTAYHPPAGADRDFGAYKPSNLLLNAPVDCDTKKQLRDKFSAMSVDELKLAAATHLCRALKDHL